MLLNILMPLPALLTGGGSTNRLKWIGAGVGAVIVIGLVVVLLRSPDKAKDAFAHCQFYEASYEWINAEKACQEAVQIDPKSKSGLAAAEVLKSVKPKAQAVRDEKAKRYASGDAPCKAGKWMTRCIFKGQKRPTPLDAPTKSRCDQDASELRSNLDDMVCPSCVCADEFEKDGGPEE